MLHTKPQDNWSYGSRGKKIFKEYLPYMGIAAI